MVEILLVAIVLATWMAGVWLVLPSFEALLWSLFND